MTRSRLFSFIFLGLAWLFSQARPLYAVELKGDIVVFKDKQEAASYALPSLWSLVSPESRKGDYIKTQAIVESLWPEFCKRYPKCEEYPKPEVIISYNQGGSSTFGMLHEGKVRQSNVIIIPWELIDEYEGLEFVLAHEMIHYFEKHAETQDLKEEISRISRQAFGNCYDYPYPIDEVKDDLLSLMTLIDQIGTKPHMVSPYNGLPLDGELGNILEKMIRRTQYLSEECVSLSPLFFKLKRKIDSGNYLHSGDNEVANFIERATSCFEKYDGNLLKDTMGNSNLKPTDQSEQEIQKFKELINKDGPELSRLIELRNKNYSAYSNLSRKLSAPQLRYQTEEDIADVGAIEVLLNAGKKDLKKYTNYLLVDLPTQDQIRCKDDLEKGREPNYGPLNRPHHSECWRIWRALEMEKEFHRPKTIEDKNNQETPR